jgi:signal transduction histidine kinase
MRPSPPLGLSRLSGKIFVAFLVVLATFGGVTAYGALTVRRLGDEVQRLAGGYLALRLELHDLQTRQLNLVQLVERSDEESERSPRFVKSAVDAARRYRKANVRKIEALADTLLASAPSGEEQLFLRGVDERLRALENAFADDEELFDSAFGPLGAKPIAVSPRLDPRHDASARERLWRREAQLLQKDIGDLTRDLRGREQLVADQLDAHERRAVYATVLLALLAAAIGLGVMFLAQRALAPLAPLAASAKQIARGEYRQRVEVRTDDEIGALASEFNAMAAALEERELRLIRSERLAAVGRVAAQITHEVRNPLSSIGLNAELLEEELGALDGDGEARTLARAIVKEVDRLGEITEQYLRFARLPRPKLEREDLNGIVESLLAFLREELSARGVRVEAQLAPALPLVAADENQVRQALLNILRNGAEAMRDGGRLRVATAVEDGQVIVRIDDEGEGIAVEDQAKIFDAFFSTKESGTGLGLALTQQIVVEHGGTIDVASQPGRGCTFTVRLPALPPAPSASEREPAGEVAG